MVSQEKGFLCGRSLLWSAVMELFEFEEFACIISFSEGDGLCWAKKGLLMEEVPLTNGFVAEW